MSAQERDFSVGSIKRQIMAQAVPLTVAQVVQLLYNVVDRIYIGHQPEAGDLALTGLGARRAGICSMDSGPLISAPPGRRAAASGPTGRNRLPLTDEGHANASEAAA